MGTTRTTVTLETTAHEYLQAASKKRTGSAFLSRLLLKQLQTERKAIGILLDAQWHGPEARLAVSALQAVRHLGPGPVDSPAIARELEEAPIHRGRRMSAVYGLNWDNWSERVREVHHSPSLAWALRALAETIESGSETAAEALEQLSSGYVFLPQDRPFIVYLDHNIWCTHIKQPTEETKALFNFLREGVKQGAVRCPVSLIHIVETANWSNAKLVPQLVDLYVEISRGRAMKNYAVLAANEHRGIEVLGDAEVVLGNPGDLPPAIRPKYYGTNGDQERMRLLFDLRSDRSFVGRWEFMKTNLVKTLTARFGSNEPVSELSGPRKRAIESAFSKLLRDPGRKARQGDPADLMHVGHAAFADCSMLDTKTSKVIRSIPKDWPWYCTPKPNEMLSYLKERLTAQ